MKENNNSFIDELNILPYNKKDEIIEFAELYMENSKLNKFNIIQFGNQINSFLLNNYLIKRSLNSFKLYYNCKKINISKYIKTNIENSKNLFDLIKSRRTKREFEEFKMPIEDIASLLHYTYGISYKSNFIKNGIEFKQTYRMAPSPGGLYPLEFYFIAINCNIEKGIYHYSPKFEQIEKIFNYNLEKEELNKKINANGINLKYICGIIIITSILERLNIKYKFRSYRFMLIEVGLVTQNIVLISNSLNLSSCILGGYLDDEVNNLIGVDGKFENVQNVILIGK